MKVFTAARCFLPCSMAACICVWSLLSALPSPAQDAAPKKGTKTTKAPAPTRPKMTEADLQKLWDNGDEPLLLNELKLRSIAFEPEEEWVGHLPDPSRMPLAIAALRKLIPPPPTVDAVTSAAPDLLAKLKDAAQKRSEADMAPLVHPALLANKARVYDLFDIANYRNHSLGHVVPAENRRVGVQFFQLTTSQVERLHYLMFSTYGGHIVLRDIVSGPEVATLFLHDEQQLATAKLDLMFRALNDHDNSGLKNLCTPGMFESLNKLTDGGGSTLVRGKYSSISAIALTPAASLDQKSARVVVKVGYPDAGSKPLEYFVDFERVDKDLKVVRVRDLQGGVVAWDPDIDNYLNRRYGLPDGATVTDVPKSDDSRFYPLSMMHSFVIKALESRNAAKLKELSKEFIARQPTGGDGLGIQAAAEHISGTYEDAARDAALAIDRGGTAWFVVLRHNSAVGSVDAIASGRQFSPVILGVSKQKIDYIPFVDQGRPAEQIAIASITQNQLEKRYGAGKPRPFMNLDFNNGGGKNYNLAAFGTGCPGDSGAGPDSYTGGSICPSAAAPAAQQQTKPAKSRFGLPSGMPGLPAGLPTSIPGMPGGNKNQPAPNMLVPAAWQPALKVVVDSIDDARRGAAGQPQK